MRSQRWGNVRLDKFTNPALRWLRRGRLLIFAVGLTLVLLGNSEIAHMNGTEAAPEPAPTNAAVYHFKLGDINAMVVSDGTLTFPPSFFVPKADPEAVTATLTEHFLSTEEVFAHINTMYLETEEHKVLIDTGSGTLFGPTAGHLLENLEAAGVEATDIDTVLLTHAHPNHIGGILDADGGLSLPNAQFYISQSESDFGWRTRWICREPFWTKKPRLDWSPLRRAI